ncbi:MAG TPA: helix-turn-helix domain-containing protein [Longimicrobiaceae bacterium]|nr:helix-turn-helix domain-containing protein [Longimicrobiaceae bacterium]
MAEDQETEQRILDAAHAVFMRRGTEGARMQEIAEEAGVNKALLHYYFRSKDKLAEAVFVRAGRRLFPPVIATLTSELPLEDKVRRVVEIELDNLSASPHLPGYVLCEVNHHPERVGQLAGAMAGRPVEGFGRGIAAGLQAQIDERVAQGKMRPIAAEQFMANLLSLCLFPFAAQPMLRALMAWDADGFTRFVEERKRTLPEFFLNALRP